MSKIIECQVNDEYVLGSGVVIGAAGSYGDVILRLKFNEMWDGLAIMATFKDALNKSPVVIMLVPSMLADGEVRTYEVHIPQEAKRTAGRARLTLTGYSIYTIEDETIKPFKDSLTNTSTAFFRVLESDAAIADDGSIDASQTPTLAEQAQIALNYANGKLVEADAKLDKVERNLEDTQIILSEAQEKLEEVDNRVTQKLGEVDAKLDEADNRVTEKLEEVDEKEAERDAAEQKRAEAEEKRTEQIGKIDTALDRIIEIQNSLMGGGTV